MNRVYEALAENESAQLEWPTKLRALSAELVESLKREVTIDWDRRSDVEASIRAKVSDCSRFGLRLSTPSKQSSNCCSDGTLRPELVRDLRLHRRPV